MSWIEHFAVTQRKLITDNRRRWANRHAASRARDRFPRCLNRCARIVWCALQQLRRTTVQWIATEQTVTITWSRRACGLLYRGTGISIHLINNACPGIKREDGLCGSRWCISPYNHQKRNTYPTKHRKSQHFFRSSFWPITHAEVNDCVGLPHSIQQNLLALEALRNGLEVLDRQKAQKLAGR